MQEGGLVHGRAHEVAANPNQILKLGDVAGDVDHSAVAEGVKAVARATREVDG